MRKIVTAIILAIFLIMNLFYGYTGSLTVYAGNITTYRSNDFMYTLRLPDSVTIDNFYGTPDPVLKLSVPSAGLKAAVSSEPIDEATFESVREYLDNKTASDRAIFDEIVEIKNSSFAALKQNYQYQFLFGASTEEQKESNIKIFSQSTEIISGVESSVTLYNIISYNTQTVNETTYLNIMIPVFENRSIYNFLFAVKRGNLNASAISSIVTILKAVEIDNLEKPLQVPPILLDNSAVTQANEGFFSVSEKLEDELFFSLSMGYLFQYPADYIPYKESSFLNALQYKSFRIDPFTVFSIQAEKVQEDYNAIQDKINMIAYSDDLSSKIVNGGIKSLGKNHFVFIDYETQSNGSKQYATGFYIQKDTMLYTLKLESVTTPINPKTKDDFFRIGESLELFPPNVRSPLQQSAMNSFMDAKKGIDFVYPSNWKLSMSLDPVSTTSLLQLKNPAMSSPLEITVREENLKAELQYNDLLNLTKADSEEVRSYFDTIELPYEKFPHTLIAGSFTITGTVPTLTRLVNYLDENQRQHFCCSISLIQGTQVHTMFIDINEYGLAGDQILDLNLLPTINKIADSFSLYRQ